MKKILVLLLLTAMLVFPSKSLAIEDPLSVSNNKFGIHILFPEEIKEAARLVNSSGGDWGYVLIPIQAGDKNLTKWQKFMDDSRKYHLIPIIRLASEGDFFNTKVWRKPNFNDVLDFANFLNSLNWPVKNRYIVVFNEPNRGDEWGGIPNPQEYANILNYAYSTFKSKDSGFFVISAGMDNAAATVAGQSLNGYEFLTQMNSAVPGIFSQIDGFGSHSYPNPGFSQPPYKTGRMSIQTFIYEKNLIKSFGEGSDLPVFITETGWTKKILSEDLISSYYKDAFALYWNKQDILAITPFLLKAGSAPFDVFSLINQDGTEGKIYKTIQTIAKTEGKPVLNPDNAASLSSVLGQKEEILKTKNFINPKNSENAPPIFPYVKQLLKWLLRI